MRGQRTRKIRGRPGGEVVTQRSAKPPRTGSIPVLASKQGGRTTVRVTMFCEAGRESKGLSTDESFAQSCHTTRTESVRFDSRPGLKRVKRVQRPGSEQPALLASESKLLSISRSDARSRPRMRAASTHAERCGQPRFWVDSRPYIKNWYTPPYSRDDGMVDIEDLKSSERVARMGSSPIPGTANIRRFFIGRVL